MANKESVKAAVEKFEVAQLDSLAVEVPKVLGSLSADVRQKINDLLPTHLAIFDEEVNKLDVNASDFKFNRTRIFEAIYGAGVAEDRAKPFKVADGPFAKRLDTFLAKGADRDSAAIKSAMYRLALYCENNDFEASGGEVEALLSDLFKKADNVAIQKLSREIEEAKKNRDGAKESLKYFKSDDFNGFEGAISDFENEAAALSFVDKDRSLGEQLIEIDDEIAEADDLRKASLAKKGAKAVKLFLKKSKAPDLRKLNRDKSKLEGLKTKSDQLIEDVLNFLKNLKDSTGIFPALTNDQKKDLGPLHQKFMRRKSGRVDFVLSDFNNDMKAVSGLLSEMKKNADPEADFDKLVSGLDDEISKKEEKLKEQQGIKDTATELSPEEFARRVVDKVLEKEVAGLDPKVRAKATAAVLMEDIGRFQRGPDPQAVIDGMNAETFAIANEFRLRDVLFNFSYSRSGETKSPFEDLALSDIESWEKVKSLFETGQLEFEDGFIMLRALMYLNDWSESEQTIGLRKYLRKQLEDKLGATDKLPNAAVSEIVEEAFDEQLKKTERIFGKYLDNIDKRETNVTKGLLKTLENRLASLKHRRRTEQIDPDDFEDEYISILNEAESYGLTERLGIEQDAVLARFANSPRAQKLRDAGHFMGSWLDTKGKAGLVEGGRLAKDFSLASFWETFKVGGWILIGAAELAWSIPRGLWNKEAGFLKTSQKLATKAGVGTVNAGKRLGAGAFENIKRSFANVFNKKYEGDSSYAARSNTDLEALDKANQEIADRLKADPVKIGATAFVDLDKYKNRIDKLNVKKQDEEKKK